MSVNRYLPHVLVIPEDDANSQLANGFVLDLDSSVRKGIQVLPEAGGWLNVLNEFESYHVAEMDRYPQRHIILLIDFDGEEGRLNRAQNRIPERLKGRVFILGAWTQPEALKSALGSYEAIGANLAKDCREETKITWDHDLLRHNESEIARLRQHVRPILFN